MPLQEPDPEQTEKIRDHWFAHRCLPFPADGLVPREHTAVPPVESLSARAQAVAAADFAAALMARDAAAVEALQQVRVRAQRLDETDDKASTAGTPRPNPKSPLTTLAAVAAIGFATRHADLLDAQAAPRAYHPGVPVARAFERLRDDRPDGTPPVPEGWPGVGDQPFFSYLAALYIRVAPGRIANEAPQHQPYAVHCRAQAVTGTPATPAQHGYRCTCQPGYLPDVLPKVRVPRSAAEIEPVRRMLAHPGAEWWLLGRLFLCAVHVHFGWLPYRQTPRAPQKMLHGLMLRLLQRQVTLPNADPRHGLIVGLVHGLQWSVPPDAVEACRELPPVLTDLMPQAPATLMRQALRYLGEAALKTSFFETQLPEAIQLARDIASDATSPALAVRAGASAGLWQAISKRMEEIDQDLIDTLCFEAAPRPPDRARHLSVSTINPTLLRDVLLAHKKLINTYVGWMASRGHDIVDDLLNTTDR